MKLMIVESPVKVKTIKKYLGDDWIVTASLGHIRDLPEKELGIDMEGFKPKYVVSKGKGKVIKELKNKANRADVIYIASDSDREGEAIAWHIKEVLKISKYKRIAFNEITQESILNAVDNSRLIDMGMVHAQEARRVLDRLVGFKVSPKLSSDSGVKLSAGRVQSPALKLVVMREGEINNHDEKEYYTVEANVKEDVTAVLDSTVWAEDNEHIFNNELIAEIAKIKVLKVTEVKNEKRKVKPRPPLITSTLQQAASTCLKYSPAKTMELAQALFEKGAITYHRTDNPNLSSDGFNKVSEYLKSKNMEVQEDRIKWKSKASAQEAHEAIRPSDINIVKISDDKKEQALYGLIRERSISSAMPFAIDSITKIILESNDFIEFNNIKEKPVFIATGVVETEKGWRANISIERLKDKSNKLSSNFITNENVDANCKILNKKTKPPKRYTEASLVNALDKLGIGRPSTYASIMENIKRRKYIEIKVKNKDKVIFATDKGIMLVQALSAMSFMKLDYTRIMEDQLDLIAKGEGRYLDLMKEVNGSLDSELKNVSIKSLVKKSICPICNNSVKQLKSKKTKGYFWVHEEPNDDCEKYLSDKNDSPVKPEATNTKKEPCPKCNKTLIQKYSSEKEFHFWVHEERKSKCEKFIKDSEGLPIIH